MAAARRPDRAHQLSSLTGILPEGVQSLLALVGVLGQVRGVAVHPETHVHRVASPARRLRQVIGGEACELLVGVCAGSE